VSTMFLRSKRRRLRTILPALAILPWLLCVQQGCSGTHSESIASSPLVIVYTIDTLRADHLSAYGYDRDTSPYLDGFARDAVLYKRAHVQSSWTRPSVGSLLTGLYPSRHGAVRRMDKLRADATTLAEVLTHEGYTSTAFITNPNLLPEFGFDQGFERMIDIESVARTATAQRVHDAVFAYLDTKPEGPLFLYIHTLDPHTPYAAPERFPRRFLPRQKRLNKKAKRMAVEESRYDREIAYADDEFGSFLKELKRRGLYDDAVILVLSDHGEEFGEHGGRTHGKTLFEEQLHVPLIVRLPGGEHSGSVVEQAVRVVDLFPTLLRALDIAVPKGIDGLGFQDWLDPYPKDNEPPFYSEVDKDRTLMASLTYGRYKLIRRLLPHREDLLFDIASDPGEQHDISEEKPAVLHDLERRLLEIETMAGGVYLDLVNGADSATHIISGSVRVTDAHITEVLPSNLEEGDVLELSPDRKTLTFRVTLENRPNPTQERPRTIVDLDRIRISLDPESANLVFSGMLDGQPFREGELWLGDNSEPALPPETIHTDDLVSTGSAAMLRRTHRSQALPHARLYRVPSVRAAEAIIDPDLRERLEALGYGDTETRASPAPGRKRRQSPRRSSKDG